MKNNPRSVKQLTDGSCGRWKSQPIKYQVSNNQDASHTATLNMLTEIYHRWNKTYPAIFCDDSALVKQPTLVTNGTTGRNTVEQRNPKNLILSGEKSRKEHAGLFQTPQKITPTLLIPTATDVSLI